MPISTANLKGWLLVLVFHLSFLQVVKTSPNTQYNTFYPAMYLSGAQPGTASPPPASALPAASPEPSSTPLLSPSSAPFSPAVPPTCPVDNLSCDGIGEPSWCCTSSQRCVFDDGGDIACCPLGNFCKGTVNYGAGGGSGTGRGTPNGGTGPGGVTAGSEGGSTTMNQGGGSQEVDTAGEGAALWHSKAMISRGGWEYAELMGLVIFVFGVAIW